MKISFVIYSMRSGGAERVVALLANYFVKKYEVEIITFTKEESFYDLNPKIKHTKLGIDYISRNKLHTIKNFFKRVRVLSDYLRRSNTDVVISFMTITNFLTIIASKIANKKVIVSERVAYDFYGWKINLLKKIFYRFCDMLILQTKSDSKFYSVKKKVIPNPINIDCSGTFDFKEKMVLGVGRLEEQKNFKLLIKVFSQIQTDWKLFIAGDGTQKEELEKMIKKDNIKLIGIRKDIFDFYKKASIFVLSSKKEGFPNALIEAMACGCACVAFDCPYGPSEIIENYKNGILVENQNEEKLKEAIELLIKDENLRKKLAKEAVKVKEKYSIEKIADEWENAIEEVLKKAKIEQN